MRSIKPVYEVITEEVASKKIERIARVCYKSEELIAEGTDKKMICKLLQNNHLAMLEHASLCFIVSEDIYLDMLEWHNDIRNHMYDHTKDYPMFLRFSNIGYQYIISGNITAWITELRVIAFEIGVLPLFFPEIVEDTLQQDRGTIFDKEYSGCRKEGDLNEDDLMYEWQEDDVERVTNYEGLSDAERIIHETFSVLFTSDRGITHELVRMRRDTSFAQESTRYCDYYKGKSGGDLSIIVPYGFDDWTDEQKEVWHGAMQAVEEAYMKLVKSGMKPQMARGVLPQNVKADIVITTTLSEWQHIFNLRACDATGPAHPQMKEVMIPLCKEMQEKYPFAFGHLQVAEM